MMTKITMLLTVVFIQSAIASHGQQVSLQVKNAPVTQVLYQLSKQSGYDFIYDAKLLQDISPITINVRNAPFQEVLTQCFEGQPIEFAFNDNHSVIIKQKKPVQVRTKNQNIISGTVVDSVGRPIEGVSIIVRGTSRGTTTNESGQFRLQAESGQVLVFHIIGYRTKEISVGEEQDYAITLQTEQSDLEEVVVVGYGTQKKVNLTGAVSSVDFDNNTISSRPITNVTSALSGTIPGLYVRQGSGIPGADGASLRVRGVGSLNAGQDPLVLIDGQPGDISQISANDVASVTVLKDAASASIYGSRASNGVIMVTTKKGSNTNGKIDLTYTGNTGWNRATRLPDLIDNTSDFMRLVNQVAGNSNRTALYTNDFIEQWTELSKTDPVKYPNTNWFDALFKSDILQTHQFSLRGGNDQLSSYTSFNYQKNNGLMSNTAYQVVNLRSNTDYKINDWLKIGVNASGMLGNNDAGSIDGALFWFDSATPGMVPKAPDGRYGAGQTGTGTKNNPLWIVESTQGEKLKRRFTGKFFAVLTPMDGLTVNGSYFKDIYNYKENIVITDLPRWDFRLDQQVTTGNQGIITNSDANSDRYVIDLFATYHKTIAQNHNISLLAGYNEEYNKNWSFNARKAGLISLTTPVLSAASDLQSADGGKDDYAMQSYFGRLNYDFAGKYLFEANMRIDGSSRFSPENRWGTFPSFSAGWRLSEESFWEPLKSTLNDFKLRASYGRLGNNGIGNYEWQSVYSPANTSFGNIIQQGVITNAIANRNIYWEKTDVTDIGLDISLFGDFGFTFDYYNKLTHNILYRNPIPFVNGGLGAPMVNSASVSNRGFEIAANYNKAIGDFKLSVTANGAYNKNKILDYKGGYLEINGSTVWTEGQPIGKYYVREVDHIVQDQSEIDQLLSEGWTFSPSTPGPGDFLYKDLNNDKKIDDNDRVLKGQPLPLITYGGALSLGYKNFDFSAFFTGVAGWDRYISTGIYALNSASDERLFLKEFMNQWSETNPSTTIPKLYTGNEKNSQISDYYLQSASFFRIKTIQLGYTIPSLLTEKVKIKQIRAYVNLENFFTMTKYPGMDPEMGGDIGYPILKTVSAGVNVKF